MPLTPRSLTLLQSKETSEHAVFRIWCFHKKIKFYWTHLHRIGPKIKFWRTDIFRCKHIFNREMVTIDSIASLFLCKDCQLVQICVEIYCCANTKNRNICLHEYKVFQLVKPLRLSPSRIYDSWVSQRTKGEHCWRQQNNPFFTTNFKRRLLEIQQSQFRLCFFVYGFLNTSI